VVSDWNEWGGCSSDCGYGHHIRTRMILSLPTGGREGCTLDLKESRPCSGVRCKGNDCTWGQWTSWSLCSTTCGSGSKDRTRTIMMPATLGRLPCKPQSTHESLPCNQNVQCVGACAVGIDGFKAFLSAEDSGSTGAYVKEEEKTDAADTTALEAAMKRLKNRISLHTKGGKPEAVKALATEADMDHSGNLDKTELKIVVRDFLKLTESEISNIQIDLLCDNLDAGKGSCIDGSWSNWGAWGDCSATCDGGLQTRLRVQLTQANECGKTAQGSMEETQSCNTDKKCFIDVDCKWAEWTAYSTCKAFEPGTCSGGQRRTRKFTPALGLGLPCSGPTVEEQGCDVEMDPTAGVHCKKVILPTDCVIDDWSAWGACENMDECGHGQKTRTRTVVPPMGGGTPCSDMSTEQTMGCTNPNAAKALTCKNGQPTDCVWADWKDWEGKCVKCGEQITRQRTVDVMPAFGGKGCDFRSTLETYGCEHLCHDFWCGWLDWEDWGTCSTSCGKGGTRTRVKHLGKVDKPIQPVTAAPSKLYELEALEKQLKNLGMNEEEELGHSKDLALAFGGGMLCFVALLGGVSLIGRWRNGARSLLPESADGPQNGGRYSSVQVSPATPLVDEVIE